MKPGLNSANAGDATWPEAPAPETPRTGWPAVVGCFFLAVFAWSFGFYGQAVFLAGLQQQNGWPASLISAATTSYYLIGALVIAVVPDLLGRLGLRTGILIGMALLAGAAVALPRVGSAPALFAAHAVMAAGWALTSSTAISTALAPWFGRRRGLAISLALNGASASGFLTVPLMIRATASLGFARGIDWAAGLLVVLVAPIILVCLRPPSAAWLAAERAHSGPAVATGPTGPRPAPETKRAVLAMPRFWLLALPFSLALMAQAGFAVHQVALLLPRLGTDKTAVAVALMTSAALAGRLALSTVIDRLDRRTVMAACVLLQAASLGAMLAVPAESVFLAASFTFGLSVGNLITLPALLVLDEFAPASFGMVLGLTTALGQMIYAFGPLLLGFLHDLSGGYGAALAACMALEIGAAALILGGRPR